MKQAALTALSVFLAAICVFCAIFSAVMASKPDPVPNGDKANISDSDGENGGDSQAGDTINTPDTSDPGESDNTTPEQPSGPKKRVAITLDDGPYSGYQKKFIDEMSKYGGTATFFIVGNRVDWHESTGPGLVYAVENGWEVGIHGWSHTKFFDKCSDADYESEINNTVNIIHKYLPNYDIKLLRPPGAQITSARAAASPYAIIRWDVDSLDYNYQTNTATRTQEENVQAIVNNVLANVRDGSIILMHELYENSYLAYCEILKILSEQGYEFVSVSELLGDKYQSGKVFTSGR